MLLPLLAYTSSKTKNRVEDIWMTSPHPLNTAMTSPTAAKLVQGTAIHQDKSRINPGYLLSSQPQFQRSHSQTRAESSSFSSSRMNPQLSETHCATTCILTLQPDIKAFTNCTNREKKPFSARGKCLFPLHIKNIFSLFIKTLVHFTYALYLHIVPCCLYSLQPITVKFESYLQQCVRMIDFIIGGKNNQRSQKKPNISPDKKQNYLYPLTDSDLLCQASGM